MWETIHKKKRVELLSKPQLMARAMTLGALEMALEQV